jgi:hypothetical protein
MIHHQQANNRPLDCQQDEFDSPRESWRDNAPPAAWDDVFEVQGEHGFEAWKGDAPIF